MDKKHQSTGNKGNSTKASDTSKSGKGSKSKLK